MSASIILLCEDDRTNRFVRRFLKHRNFDTHDIFAVPRRNIETWLWYLKTGEAVDETDDYKGRFRNLNASALHGLADELFRMCPRAQQLPSTAPSSLQAACREYPKLKHFLR